MPDEKLILIIDDDPAFLEIFSTKLSSVGFRVETAGGPEEGIEKAKALKPNLVLLDVNMPKMDGAQVLLKLQEDEETKNLKVVFLTSLGNPWEEAQSLSRKVSKEFGAAGYIKKTEDLEVIAEKVKAFIQ